MNELSKMSDVISFSDNIWNNMIKNQSWSELDSNLYSYTGSIYPMNKIGSINNYESRKLKPILKKISYSPNFKMTIDLPFSILDYISLSLSKIIAKEKNKKLLKVSLYKFIEFLYEKYSIDDPQLRIIHKLADLDPDFKINLTMLKSVLKSVISNK